MSDVAIVGYEYGVRCGNCGKVTDIEGMGPFSQMDVNTGPCSDSSVVECYHCGSAYRITINEVEQ